jgi:hypothetical protein
MALKEVTMKFIFKNEKEKAKYHQDMEKVLILYNKFEMFDYGNSSLSSGRQQDIKD